MVAHANICDEEAPGSAGAERERRPPAYGFTESYQLYQRARDDAGREPFQIRLREFVVFNSRLAHTRHLAFGAEQGFDPAFMAHYEDALAWGLALCEPGGESAYAEHEVYQARPDRGSQVLAKLLFTMAYRLGHQKAGYEGSLTDLEDERGWIRRVGAARLHTEASDGYAPAQEVLASLYARGHVVPLDRARVRTHKGDSLFGRSMIQAPNCLGVCHV